MEGSFSTYYEDDNIKVVIQELDGFAFIHMDVQEWNKEAYKFVKKSTDGLFNAIEAEGYEWAFATSEQEQSVKFWNLLKKCHTVKTFGPNDEYWIGAWKLGES